MAYEQEPVWIVIWRDGGAIESVSAYRSAHDAVAGIVSVWPRLVPQFEVDPEGRYTGAEIEGADDTDDFWLECCGVLAPEVEAAR